MWTGVRPFGLARQRGIPQAKAKDDIAAYFERYPGIRDYMEAGLSRPGAPWTPMASRIRRGGSGQT